MRIGRPGFFLAVLALAVAALPALPASAAAPGDEFKWSVVPSSRSGPSGRSRFEYTLKPREEIADWVAVSNLGKKPLKVDIYATDALNAPDGGFALMLANQQPKGVGSWVALQVKQYTVPVGKRVDIPFRLKVPANAEPGDHIGGIIASATEATTNAEGQQVNVERRVAARVYLRVDGPLQPVAQITAVDVQYDNPLQPFGGRDMTVTYRVANLGNVRFSGTSRVVVKGPLGVRVANSELIDIPELLPDSEVRLTRKVSGVFPAGRLSAEVIVNPTAQSGALESLSESRSCGRCPGSSSPCCWRRSPYPCWCGGGAGGPAGWPRSPASTTCPRRCRRPAASRWSWWRWPRWVGRRRWSRARRRSTSRSR
ncbi:WxL protein peptidoglycan domain-containing protein [Phytohabitans rumicis]|uniref:DUF916 domain-containing protein n=1 Tax=Phytohabitans rumicis TaxID=1076125 RepID=A0A6V8KVS6_9ACTN|nr:DUF916 domain-containing protein [Phytohabitans rumicis]GFJ86511.1 hypothetical protein Prum_001530 [Phytohabitans rumicis]